MINRKTQTATNISSFVLAFLASSHHWIHMGIMMLLGGSTNMMSTMSAVFWIRRIMILLTLVTIGVSIYRLYKHRCKDPLTLLFSSLSVVVSLGFIFYTLNRFGW